MATGVRGHWLARPARWRRPAGTVAQSWVAAPGRARPFSPSSGCRLCFPPVSSPSPGPSAAAGGPSSPTATGQPSAEPASMTAAPTPTPFVPTGSRIVYSRQLSRSEAGCDEFPTTPSCTCSTPTTQTPGGGREKRNIFELDPVWSADGSRVGGEQMCKSRTWRRGHGGGGGDMVIKKHRTLACSAAPGIDGRMAVPCARGRRVHVAHRRRWTGPGPDRGTARTPPVTECFGDVRYRSDGALILHSRPIEARVEIPRHDGGQPNIDSGPARPDRRHGSPSLPMMTGWRSSRPMRTTTVRC